MKRKDGRILGSKDGRMKGIRMEGWKNGQEQKNVVLQCSMCHLFVKGSGTGIRIPNTYPDVAPASC